MSCAKASVGDEAFCEDHLKFCPRRAPMSGAEPPYEPDRWNGKKEVRVTHNCFSYAMNVIDIKQILNCLKDSECDTPFHQPGSVSGYPKFNDTDPKTCPNMISRIMGDNPSVVPSAFELKCPAGSSKIALIIDEDEDYHFLRQDKPKAKGLPGFFSQKSGSLPVTDRDAKGHKIFDVQLANHNFNRPRPKEVGVAAAAAAAAGGGPPLKLDTVNPGVLNYDRFCGYFCVPRNKPLYMKVGGKRVES
jgi:hypothetical protein